MYKRILQQYAYEILRNAYPTKLSAKEIAEQIRMIWNISVSDRVVRNMLKKLALTNPHFGKYYYRPNRIKFSVYMRNTPFTI